MNQKNTENNKELNDMESARKKFDNILKMDNSFNKYLKEKNIQKKVNNSEVQFLNDDDKPDNNDDYDLNDSNAYDSNYHFYNESYKLLKLPKKLEYDKVITFDIFPDFESVQKDINNFFTIH